MGYERWTEADPRGLGDLMARLGEGFEREATWPDWFISRT